MAITLEERPIRTCHFGVFHISLGSTLCTESELKSDVALGNVPSLAEADLNEKWLLEHSDSATSDSWKEHRSSLFVNVVICHYSIEMASLEWKVFCWKFTWVTQFPSKHTLTTLFRSMMSCRMRKSCATDNWIRSIDATIVKSEWLIKIWLRLQVLRKAIVNS